MATAFIQSQISRRITAAPRLQISCPSAHRITSPRPKSAMASFTGDSTTVTWNAFVEAGEVTTDNFTVTKAPVTLTPKEGEVVLEMLYLSVDPYMRGRMRDQPGYMMPPFVPGEPFTGGCMAKVIESNSTKYEKDDVLVGFMSWKKFFVASDAECGGFTKVVETPGVPLTYFMNSMGASGVAAVCPIQQIGNPKAGETAFVSGAAGSTGLIACQVLKHVYGLRVVGSAGSDEKVDFLMKEIGIDAAFNYKTTSPKEGLAQYCPEGIDIYYDNVGGETLEAAIDVCNLKARIVACGMISQYNKTGAEQYGVKNLFKVVTQRLRMEGFIIGDYFAVPGMIEAFGKDMATWVAAGSVKDYAYMTEGMENAPRAFQEMMKGKNLGKAVVKC